MKTYKKSISFLFALFICAGIVAPVFKANSFFSKKEAGTENEKKLSVEEMVERGKQEQQRAVKQEKPKEMRDKGISIPKSIISEAVKEASPLTDAQVIVSQNTATVVEAEIQNEMIIHEPVKAVPTQAEKLRPEVNPAPADLLRTASNQHASRDKVKQENTPIDQNRPADTIANPSESFDFEKYGKNLIEIAGLKEGETMPVLVLDESNYKEGLRFYGYQLVARPQPLPKEPYYFAFNNKEITFAKGKCPYIGTFHPAEQADQLLFERLLSQSAYNELAKDTQFQLFYAPMDKEKECLLKCKTKTVLGAYPGDASEIAIVHGKFGKKDDAYILIIESLQKSSGEIVNINDPTSNLVSLRGNSMETLTDRH